MPWSYDSDEDYCPYCEDYGQDCGMHDDIFDDAAATLESLTVPRDVTEVFPAFVDPWDTRQPNPKYL